MNGSYSAGEHNDTFYSAVSSQGAGTPSITATPSIGGTVGSHHGSQCVLNRSDGSNIVVTPVRENRTVHKKPATEKEVRYCKYFSIMAIFLFPPSGFVALYFALKARRDYDVGLQIMDPSVVRRSVKYCERLVILSIVCGIVMYTLIFAGIGRVAYGNSDSRDGSRSTAV